MSEIYLEKYEVNIFKEMCAERRIIILNSMDRNLNYINQLDESLTLTMDPNLKWDFHKSKIGHQIEYLGYILFWIL